MTEFERSNFANLLANNKGQSRELRKLQSEMKQMASDNQVLNNYCDQLEAENKELKRNLARMNMMKNVTSIWGY